MYMTTKGVMNRYGIGRATVYRWMSKHYPIPLPKPRIGGDSGNNRWLISDLDEWDAQCEEIMSSSNAHHA